MALLDEEALMGTSLLLSDDDEDQLTPMSTTASLEVAELELMLINILLN